VPVTLCMRQRHHRDQVSQVQAIGSRIETNVNGPPALGKMRPHFFAGHLLEETPPAKLDEICVFLILRQPSILTQLPGPPLLACTVDWMG